MIPNEFCETFVDPETRLVLPSKTRISTGEGASLALVDIKSGDSFILKTYRPKELTANWQEIAGINVDLYKRIFGRNPDVSKRIAESAILHDYTSVTHAVSLIDGAPFAYAVHRKLVFETSDSQFPDGKVVADYMSRGILEAYQARGLGKRLMYVGLRMNDPDVLIVRSGTPAGIWSIINTPNEFTDVFPFTKRYNESRAAQDVEIQAVGRLRRHPVGFDINTGLLVADLQEEGMNLAYHADESHKPTMDILRTMVMTFGANLPRGDSLLVSAWRNRTRRPKVQSSEQ